MKTTIEMNGYEIVIEETAGVLSVTAMKDGETVEEFSLETSEEGSQEESEEGSEVKSFGDFGGEEEDFGGEGSEDLEKEIEETQDEEESQDEEEESQDEEDEEKMESLKTFESFLNKKK
jgi:hypothetical protein